MKANSNYRHPVITALVLTPILLAAAALSGGVGHGSYALAIILFPFATLSAVVIDPFFNSTVPMILIATIQFPIYGMLLWLGQRKLRDRLVIIALSMVHTVTVAIAFLFVYS